MSPDSDSVIVKPPKKKRPAKSDRTGSAAVAGTTPLAIPSDIVLPSTQPPRPSASAVTRVDPDARGPSKSKPTKKAKEPQDSQDVRKRMDSKKSEKVSLKGKQGHMDA
jgi:hypothetical protein